jgi:hypothetical protein
VPTGHPLRPVRWRGSIKKSSGSEAKLGYLGHVITENRNRLIVDTRLTLATGTAERIAVLEMAANKPESKRIALGIGHHTARRHQPGQRNRWPHDLPRRLYGQSAKTETVGGSLRMDQDGGFAAQNEVPRHRPGGLDVYLGRRLQLSENAKS